jgi:hypothetical protein
LTRAPGDSLGADHRRLLDAIEDYAEAAQLSLSAPGTACPGTEVSPLY